MDSNLKSALCKEIVTTLIDPLVFLGLLSSGLNQFRKDYLMKPFTKNVPVKSEWPFGDDLNKRINTISSTNSGVFLKGPTNRPYTTDHLPTDQPTTDQVHQPPTNRPSTNKKYEDQKFNSKF